MRRAASRSIILRGGLAAGAAALSAVPGRASAQTTYTTIYTLRLNIPAATTSLHFTAFAQFSRNLDRRTGGQLKLELYPNAQLATEQDSISGLSSGVLDLYMSPTIYLQSLMPRLQAFDLPFLFKDMNAVFRTLDGSIGSEIFSELEGKGIVGLAWGGGGFREFGTTGRSIKTPGDMRNLRMRFQGGPIYVAMSQALAIVPVTVDYSELFVALQQHTVDGLDLVLDSYWAGKFYTTVRHIAISNHIFSTLALVAAKRKLDSLPAPLQRALRDEAKGLRTYWRQLIAQKADDAIRQMKGTGVAFSEIDFAAFRKAVEPVYATFQSKIGSDWIERILRASG